NEYVINGETIAIRDTLLISAFGVMGDVTKAVTMDAKHAGDAVYIVGETFDELGGSYYYESMGYLGLNVPKVDAKKGKKIMEKLAKAMDDEIVKACHDCSEGGIGVAAAEMAFSGNLGMKLNLTKVPTKVKRNDKILFSESNSRFLVEVKDGKAFEKAMKGTVFAKIGEITNEKLKVECLNGYTIVDADIKDLKEAWQGTLKW
ncbi:MAG: phosphoribosylformylglycinamidine synthase, partial [bacterium]|nr:phosphoribosylformylglycinamidine synthase [bacterium]